MPTATEGPRAGASQGTTVAILCGMTVTFLLLVAFALAMFEGKNYA